MEAIIKKIEYWKNYTGTGEIYRQNNDLDCILTGGNLLADTIFSLWLPLRYVLNHYNTDNWKYWKEREADELRPGKSNLKNCEEFLEEFVAIPDSFLPPNEQLTTLLNELFRLGQTRANVMLLPYRSWNTKRGCPPYWDYLPHFLFDLLSTEDALFLNAIHTWIQNEHLTPFFNNNIIAKNHIRNLLGTEAIWKHSPTNINLHAMLANYIEILNQRAELFPISSKDKARD